MASKVELAAMGEAIALAEHVEFVPDANPRVGCVIVTPDGEVVGVGAHLGAGTAHAEVVALERAGDRARGATAVVTLEPCAHVGRTPPCVNALHAAGIARIVYAQSDPNPIASGGGAVLREAGLDVEGGVLVAEAEALNMEWSVAAPRGWPFVTLKVAASLDGRVAASDGSSRWITGVAAREDGHAIRASVGAVLVGTGTAISDDPELTDRRTNAKFQPRPAVMGFRDIPRGTKLAARNPILLRTHDVQAALTQLFNLGMRHILVEGGPGISAAFLAAGQVDRVVWYTSPKLLGEGRSAVDSLGIESVVDALTFQVSDATRVGEDIRIDLNVVKDDSERG